MTPTPDREEPPRRPRDEVIEPMRDALEFGYQGLGAVADALRGSAILSRRVMSREPVAGEPRREPPARPPARHVRPGLAGTPRPPRERRPLPEDEAMVAGQPTEETAGTQQAAPKAPPADEPRAVGLLGELAHLMADAIDLAGEVAYEVASTLTGQPAEHDGGHHGEHRREAEEIVFSAVAGTDATTRFTIWNTGSAILRDVTFTATSFRGPFGEIEDESITFEPASVAAIPSGRPQTVEVHVKIPDRQPAGRYRCLAQAEPSGAYAVLELLVTDPA